MTLRQIIELADQGYSSGHTDLPLLDYVDADGKLLEDPPTGDTLALFIVRELADVYDENATQEEQFDEATRALATARDDIEDALFALNTWWEKIS